MFLSKADVETVQRKISSQYSYLVTLFLQFFTAQSLESSCTLILLRNRKNRPHKTINRPGD